MSQSQALIPKPKCVIHWLDGRIETHSVTIPKNFGEGTDELIIETSKFGLSDFKQKKKFKKSEIERIKFEEDGYFGT